MKTFSILNYIGLNMVSASVTLWLVTFFSNYGIVLASLTGTSILIMNAFKIYGMYLDNQIKKKELEK